MIDDLKHYRRPKESRFLPDSRSAWMLELCAAVIIGASLAMGYVMMSESVR